MRNPSCSIRAEGAPRRRPRHVAVVPKQSRSFLSNTTWARDLAALEIAIEHGEQLSSFIKELDDYFRPEAWSCDTASLLLVLRADGESFFRRFSSRYRRANADLRAICRSKLPKKFRSTYRSRR